MPERWARRCSTVTRSSIIGRSAPSSWRAVVSSARVPSAIRLTTVTAVKPLLPLAMPKRVVGVIGTAWARSASPPCIVNTAPPSLTLTTPEKSSTALIAATTSAPSNRWSTASR